MTAMRWLGRIREFRRFVYSVAAYINDEGYKAFFSRVIKAVISPLFWYYKSVILIRDLYEPIKECETGEKVTYREIAYQDRAELFDIIYDDKTAIGEKLKNGHLCHVSEIDGAIGCYIWISLIDEYIPEIDTLQRIKPGEEAYIYNCRTFKCHRGKRLFSALLANALICLKEKKYKRVYSAVSAENYPSRKAMRRAGFRECHTVTFARILWFKKHYYKDLCV